MIGKKTIGDLAESLRSKEKETKANLCVGRGYYKKRGKLTTYQIILTIQEDD
jgi:aspartate/tyrosine/aromatic aminotransferase